MATVQGTAAELHDPGATRVDGRLVRVCEVTSPTIVLGSTQPDRHVRADAGVPVVHRRSGGGAVWVAPGDPVWVDVVVPAGDPLWDDDVGRATWWLGDAWAVALNDLGMRGAAVHRGPLVRTRWSTHVCFAGLGPGEVTVEGRKMVGLAQRRTRAGALFQCAVPCRWDPAPLLAALDLTGEERAAARADLGGAVAAIGPGRGEDLVAALLGHLP